MIWPFTPLNPMIEGMIFRTDRLPSFSGDQRIRLRDIPRRVFNHNYKWKGRQYERARAMFRDTMPGAFMVPDWANFSKVSAFNGSTFIAFDNTNPAIEADHNAVIIRRNSADDDEQYEELNIVGSSAIGLSLGAPLSANYENAVVAQLLECDATEGLNATRNISKFREAEIEWNCYEGENIDEEDSSHTTHRGIRVLTECSRLGEGSIPSGLTQPFELVDNGIARPFYDTLREKPIQQFGAAWQPQTRADSYLLRQFFHTIKGRQKAFWLPDMNRGLELTANIANGAGSITIRHVGFTDGYGSGDLFIKTLNGNVYTLRVTSSMESGANEVLTLSSGAPAAISMSQVDKFSMMFCVVLASDRIEWLHRANPGPKIVVPVEEVPVPA